MGRLAWLQVPFGVSVAPELFQSRLDAVIADLAGVATIVNDLLIWGEGDSLEDAVLDHN